MRLALALLLLCAAPVAAAPVLTVDTTTPAPGSPVVVTLDGGPGGQRDWLGLYPVGYPDSAWGFLAQWIYLPAGQKTMTWIVTMPASSGRYEVRLFTGTSYTRVGTTPALTVTAAGLPASPTFPGIVTADGFTSAGAGPGALTLSGTPFAQLGAPGNGTIRFCSDCDPPAGVNANCTSGASRTGALAIRVNGAWKCK